MIEKKKCAYCGKEFEGDGRQKYCSEECKEKANAGVCVICGAPTKNHRKTCSTECAHALAVRLNHDPERIKKAVDKIKATKQERYGDPNFNNNKKTQKTNLERYGSTTYLHSKEGNEKVKATMLERYGVEHALQNSDLLNKMNETIQKTGISYRFHTPEWEENMLNKYGTTVPYKNENIKKKGINTLLERYGVTSPAKLDWVKEKSKKTCLEKYGVEYSFQSENNKLKSEQTCQERYGMSMSELIHKRVKKSKINLKIAEFLGIPSSDLEFHVGNKFYDMKLGNVLIEIDPTVTHNSDKNILQKDGKPLDKNYHANKSKLALDNGYRCIHVFDWDDLDKIKALVFDKYTHIRARECEVVFIDKKTSDLFLDKYHLQGKCEGDFARVGLIYNDTLVGIMTFGIPRYNNNVQVELLRLCFSDIVVTGGSEKMFKFFVDNYKPDSMISYCDLSKYSGTVYQKLGFKLKNISQPSAHWYNMQTKQHITDNLLRQRGFDQLFGTSYGKGSLNEELMLKNGFLRVYDCGQATYIWQKEEVF